MKSIIVNALTGQLLPYLIVIVAALIIAAIGYGTKAAKHLAEGIKDEKTRNRVDSAIDAADIAAETAVNFVKQTFTDDLKAKGKLSAEDAVAALNKAKDAFFANIGATALSVLKDEFTDLESFAVNLIEEKLHLSKTAPTASASIVDPVPAVPPAPDQAA